MTERDGSKVIIYCLTSWKPLGVEGRLQARMDLGSHELHLSDSSSGVFSALETRWLPAAPGAHPVLSALSPKVSVSTVGWGLLGLGQAKLRGSLQRSSPNGSPSTPFPPRQEAASPPLSILLIGESWQSLRVGGRGLRPHALPTPGPRVHVFQGLPAWAEEEGCGHPPLLLRVS